MPVVPSRKNSAGVALLEPTRKPLLFTSVFSRVILLFSSLVLNFLDTLLSEIRS